MYEYAAICTSVVDGDTAHFDVDLGFDIWQKQVIRFYGINAPELHATDPKPGQASRDYLKKLIEGKSIFVRTLKDKDEKYGRTLANVFLDLTQKSVNQQMIDAGFAVAYFGGKR